MSGAVGPQLADTPPPAQGATPFAAGPVQAVVPMVRTPQEADALPGGAKFRSPDGQVRQRPYDVTDDASYADVPFGSYYRENGAVQQKPRPSGGIGPLAQTLYDMAKTPEGKQKALEYAYPDAIVTMERGEPIVITQDGQRLSPKAGMASRAAGFVGSQALPAAGGAWGAALAAARGAAAGPVVGIGAGMAGAAAGGAAGELENEEFLDRLGIEKLPAGERAKEAALAGGAAGLGQGLGAAVPALAAGAKAGVESLGNGLPKLAAWFFEANPEATKLAQEIASEGGRVSLKSYAPASPLIQYFVRWAKQFGYDPIGETARDVWFPKVANALMDAAGIPAAERDVIGKTAGTSIEPLGEAVKAKAGDTLREASETLDRQIASSRAAREGALREGLSGTQRAIATEQTALVTQADAYRAAAERAVQEGIDHFQAEVDKALSGHMNPGDLSRWMADRITKARTALSATAGKMYAAAHELAGGQEPNVEPLRQWAKGIVDDVPDALRAEFPREIDIISRLAGKTSETPASPILDQFGQPVRAAEKQSEPVTFGDLHQLRTFMRAKINWGDLTRGPKEGYLARLEQQINQVLNDAEATPELKAAAEQLRKADAFYGPNIRKFTNEKVRALAKFGRSATAADAEEMAQTVLQEGNLEDVRLLRDIGGEDLWRQVVAADTRNMMNEAGAKAGRIDAQRFATQIVERAESGMLTEAYPPPQAAQLRLQADRIMRVHGKVPMEWRPGDTVFTMMDRAEDYIARAEAMASKAPMEAFEKGMDELKRELAEQRGAGRQAINDDPLQALVKDNVSAEAAAKKILDNPNMMELVEKKFGADSLEWTMIRQTWLRRFVQAAADSVIPAAGMKDGGLNELARMWARFTPETQERLAPGATRDQLTRMMRKLVMMFPNEGEDMGANLSGASLILHPNVASALGLPAPAQAVLRHSPAPVSRFIISKLLNRVSKLATSPRTIAFIAKGLDGTPHEQAVAEGLLRQMMEGVPQRGAAGAAVAPYAREAVGGDESPDQPTGPVATPSWRERVPGQSTSPQSWRSRVPNAP